MKRRTFLGFVAAVVVGDRLTGWLTAEEAARVNCVTAQPGMQAEVAGVPVYLTRWREVTAESACPVDEMRRVLYDALEQDCRSLPPAEAVMARAIARHTETIDRHFSAECRREIVTISILYGAPSWLPEEVEG